MHDRLEQDVAQQQQEPWTPSDDLRAYVADEDDKMVFWDPEKPTAWVASDVTVGNDR